MKQGTPMRHRRIFGGPGLSSPFQASLTCVLTFAWIMLAHFSVCDASKVNDGTFGAHTPQWKGQHYQTLKEKKNRTT
jgi:hypothetical protein